MANNTNDRDLQIALYYTEDDMDTALSMLNGTYKDQYAVKGSFVSSSTYGAFICFYNSRIMLFSPMFMVISPFFTTGEVETDTNWIEFEKQIKAIASLPDSDSVRSFNAAESISSVMNTGFQTELKKFFDADDFVTINFRFKKMLEDRLNVQQLRLALDVEPVSSLDIERYSITYPKRNIDELMAKRDERIKEAEKLIGNRESPLAGKDVRMLLRGVLVLSPINGKKVAALEVGDKVRITIVDNHSEAIEFAKTLKIYENEKTIKPISGRIVSIQYTKKSGFEIYASVGKGVYIFITEEESDIKVDVEMRQASRSDKKEDADGQSVPLIVGACIAGLFILASVIFLIFY